MNESKQLSDWLQRKLQTPRRRLREPSRVTEKFCRFSGRTLYGRVTLSAFPAADFRYISRVKWPVGEQVRLYEDCVLDGILDVLVIEQSYPVFGIEVTLEEISWHEVDSCALAYGMAARQAMRHIIAPDRGGLNYELDQLPPT